MPVPVIARRLVAVLLLALAVFALTPALAASGADDAPATIKYDPVQDLDYVLIDNPSPVTGAKVAVVEVFGYGCPICARFQPSLDDWLKKLPGDVAFSYLPAAFNDADPEHCWDEFARAYYAAQAMGVKASAHDRIYQAKFEQGRIGTCSAIPSVYADFGPDPNVFSATMNSAAIAAKVAQAHDQALRWGVDGTPTMIVDGKYRVAMTRDGGPEGMLHTVDWLIARQRPLHVAVSAGRR